MEKLKSSTAVSSRSTTSFLPPPAPVAAAATTTTSSTSSTSSLVKRRQIPTNAHGTSATATAAFAARPALPQALSTHFFSVRKRPFNGDFLCSQSVLSQDVKWSDDNAAQTKASAHKIAKLSAQLQLKSAGKVGSVVENNSITTDSRQHNASCTVAPSTNNNVDDDVESISSFSSVSSDPSWSSRLDIKRVQQDPIVHLITHTFQASTDKQSVSATSFAIQEFSPSKPLAFSSSSPRKIRRVFSITKSTSRSAPQNSKPLKRDQLLALLSRIEQSQSSLLSNSSCQSPSHSSTSLLSSSSASSFTTKPKQESSTIAAYVASSPLNSSKPPSLYTAYNSPTLPNGNGNATILPSNPNTSLPAPSVLTITAPFSTPSVSIPSTIHSRESSNSASSASVISKESTLAMWSSEGITKPITSLKAINASRWANIQPSYGIVADSILSPRTFADTSLARVQTSNTHFATSSSPAHISDNHSSRTHIQSPFSKPSSAAPQNDRPRFFRPFKPPSHVVNT